MSGHHDLGYKYLFAHPELVRELIAEFTPFQFLNGIDASAFERVNPVYISERFTERQDDIVWRVHLGDEWIYVYILLEFQSRTDRWMALRMQVYIGLLYQDLVRRDELGLQGRLPPVFPLVFYNGRDRWNASIELGEMVSPAPDGLTQFQARQRYFLIDQKRLDSTSLAEQKTVLSMLFRMELSELPDVVIQVAPMLRAWLLEDAQAPLRQAVSAWVEQLLNREARGETTIALMLDAEGAAMGMRKFETWADALEDRGLQRGLQQGREQGLEQGKEQGLEQGRRHEAATLKCILERIIQTRFGTIPEAISARIAAASIDEMQDWIGRALTTSSPESLIGSGGDNVVPSAQGIVDQRHES